MQLMQLITHLLHVRHRTSGRYLFWSMYCRYVITKHSTKLFYFLEEAGPYFRSSTVIAKTLFLIQTWFMLLVTVDGLEKYWWPPERLAEPMKNAFIYKLVTR